MRDDRVCGVAIVNRSGRQIVLAKVVIDASSDGRVAAAAGAPFASGPQGPNVARRTIRLHCETSLQAGAVDVPEELNLLNNELTVHQGDGCVLEFAFSVELGANLARDYSQAQVASWEKGEAVLRYLEETRKALSPDRASHGWFSSRRL